MCTRKLYDETPYETTFNATVLSCMKKEWDEKEAYEVILDQTLFFPEEGGIGVGKYEFPFWYNVFDGVFGLWF